MSPSHYAWLAFFMHMFVMIVVLGMGSSAPTAILLAMLEGTAMVCVAYAVYALQERRGRESRHHSLMQTASHQARRKVTSHAGPSHASPSHASPSRASQSSAGLVNVGRASPSRARSSRASRANHAPQIGSHHSSKHPKFKSQSHQSHSQLQSKPESQSQSQPQFQPQLKPQFQPQSIQGGDASVQFNAARMQGAPDTQVYEMSGSLAGHSSEVVPRDLNKWANHNIVSTPIPRKQDVFPHSASTM